MNLDFSTADPSALIRTQVYLSPVQHQGLDIMSRVTDQTRSGLIRTAIDRFLDEQQAITNSKQARYQRLKELCGAWAHIPKNELPNIREMRSGWSRRAARLGL